MTHNGIASGFRTFLIVWFGQLISTLGSSLTGFALGVWVYQRTGSATQFAIIILFTTLPSILLAPLAGVLVDRWDRRRIMLLSDAGAGLCTLALVVLLWLGQLQTWHIWITTALSASFNALQMPAYQSATTLLVPKEHLTRASGMIQLGEAIALILAPVIAGLLMAQIQLQGVILIDVATFFFAVGTLLFVRFPKTPATNEGTVARGSLLREAGFGWRYISTRPGLLGLLFFFAASNFAFGFVNVLLVPLVLSFGSTASLGTIMSIFGGGMLVGGIVMSIWGGPRRVHGVLGGGLIGGIGVVLIGLQPWLPLVAVGACILAFTAPVMNACSQAIWQSKVAPDVQGRVFSIRRMIAWSMLPLAQLLAGPLADHVFEPMLAADGVLATNIGQLISVGTGRGIGLMYVLLGLVLVAISVLGYLNPHVRHVETELPDMIIESGAHVPGELNSRDSSPMTAAA